MKVITLCLTLTACASEPYEGFFDVTRMPEVEQSECVNGVMRTVTKTGYILTGC